MVHSGKTQMLMHTYMHTNLDTYINIHIYIHTGVCSCAHVLWCTAVNLKCSYIYTYILGYIHKHTYIHTYRRMLLRSCAMVHSGKTPVLTLEESDQVIRSWFESPQPYKRCVSLCVFVCIHMHVCTYVCMHNVCMNIYAYIYAYVYICMYTYI